GIAHGSPDFAVFGRGLGTIEKIIMARNTQPHIPVLGEFRFVEYAYPIKTFPADQRCHWGYEVRRPESNLNVSLRRSQKLTISERGLHECWRKRVSVLVHSKRIAINNPHALR